MQIPLDPSVHKLTDIPYTISYVIRKRQQLDNLNEIPSEKRPPESLIWEGTQEELEEWVSRVYNTGEKTGQNITELKIMEIEE